MANKINSVEELSGKDTTDEVVVDDLSLIPLKEDSFALCELCGRIGRRNDFYTRNNKFCSLRCHASSTRRKLCNWRFKMIEGTEHMAGMIPLEPLPQLHSWHASFDELQGGPLKHNPSILANSYEWKDELFGCDFLAAPVSLFKHAPLHDMWDNTFEGMKVEVKNSDCENLTEKLGDYFWVATVLKVKGYMGLLRYEGFGSDDSRDFWVNLCCSAVHPVGWCATLGKPLIPPKSIEEKYADWKKFLVKQLTGARTLPANFYSKLKESLKSRFSVGTVMEIVDKSRIAQVKVAYVTEIVGKRLQFRYYDSASNDDYFWCHEDSPLIHPVGWAFRIGHLLDAPQAYCQRVAAGRLAPADATFDQFHEYPADEPPLFTQGMKIEAIDPLNLSSICAATVMQILNEGYMMIKIDCYPADETCGDWFCYHQRSPYIFPVGFAQASNIPMKPPLGSSAAEFTWERHLGRSGARAAPRGLFRARGHLVQHGFVAGMRLECVDLMDPKLVCIATVHRVVADLLKIHFDGWGEEYDQWLWAHSTDIYPVGWARAVGHRLEGPQRSPAPRPPRKARATRHAKRRKKVHVPPTNQPLTPEESSQNSDSLAEPPKNLSPLTTTSETSGDVDTRHSEISEKASEPTPEQNSEHNSEHSSEPSSEQNSKQSSELPEQVPELAAESNSEEAAEKMDTNDKNAEDSAERASVMAESETSTSTSASEAPQEMGSQDETPDVSPTVETQSDKVIPRLVNQSGVPLGAFSSVDPKNWTPADVAEFLTVNDCQPYCVNFGNITGPMLLQLSKDEIIELLEMKVGPSLKIFDLIQQLKCKIKQPQRLLSSFK